MGLWYTTVIKGYTYEKIIKMNISHNEKDYIRLINAFKNSSEAYKVINKVNGVSLYCFDDNEKNWMKKIIKGSEKCVENDFSAAQSEIFVQIKVDDNIVSEEDNIYLFKYLPILRRVNPNISPYIYLDCSCVFYQKIASLLFIDNIYDLDYTKDVEIKDGKTQIGTNNYYSRLFVENNHEELVRLPLSFNHSKEWISIIPIIGNNNDEANKFINKIFNVLRLPIKNDGSLVEKGDSEICADNWVGHCVRHEDKQSCMLNNYFLKLLYNNFGNVDFMNKKDISQMPALAVALYSLLEKDPNVRNVNERINCCLDYCDGLLQLIENAYSYSDPGSIIIRANDNNSNVSKKLHFNEKLVDKRNENNSDWFLRISITDSSNSSIYNNFAQKYDDLDEITLNDIFENKGKIQEHYSKLENAIHHYGLSTFASIVEQTNGIFMLVSADRESCKYDKRNFMEFSGENSFVKSIKQHFIETMIEGTSYEILFPFNYVGVEKVPPFILYDTIDNPEEYSVIKLDFFDKKKLDQGIKKAKKSSGVNYQKWKENAIELQTEEFKNICNKLSRDKEIILCDLRNAGGYQRIETIGKIIMGAIANISKSINIALVGMETNEFVSMIRQFAVFYDKVGKNKYMKNSQVYFLSKDCSFNATLAGEDIFSLLHNLNHERMTSSVYFEKLTMVVNGIIKRYPTPQSDGYFNNGMQTKNDIVPFEDCLQFAPDGEWICHAKLRQVLETNIHTNQLGCLIPDIHIKVGKVHMDRFYEAQFLFGNSYWMKKFSSYIVHCVTEKFVKQKKKFWKLKE